MRTESLSSVEVSGHLPPAVSREQEEEEDDLREMEKVETETSLVVEVRTLLVVGSEPVLEEI